MLHFSSSTIHKGKVVKRADSSQSTPTPPRWDWSRNTSKGFVMLSRRRTRFPVMSSRVGLISSRESTSKESRQRISNLDPLQWPMHVESMSTTPFFHSSNASLPTTHWQQKNMPEELPRINRRCMRDTTRRSPGTKQRKHWRTSLMEDYLADSTMKDSSARKEKGLIVLFIMERNFVQTILLCDGMSNTCCLSKSVYSMLVVWFLDVLICDSDSLIVKNDVLLKKRHVLLRLGTR